MKYWKLGEKEHLENRIARYESVGMSEKVWRILDNYENHGYDVKDIKINYAQKQIIKYKLNKRE